MAKKRKGLNKHQKAAFKAGDHRTRRDEIGMYLEFAESDNAQYRLEAAQNLCPCHVRTHIDEVWAAIFRMMEDPDIKVRQAAWHTLEDGGIPDSPVIDDIFARAVANLEDEPDRLTRVLIEEFAVPRIREREKIELDRQRMSMNPYPFVDRCDFCGAVSVNVRRDFDTELELHSRKGRFALVCRACDA